MRLAIIGLLCSVLLCSQVVVKDGDVLLPIGEPAGVHNPNKPMLNLDTGKLQWVRESLPGFLPGQGLVALYGMGPQADLNPSARWWTAGQQLWLHSEDMTGTGWTGTATVDDATHVTFTAQYDLVYRQIIPIAGASYTVYARARRISGNYDLCWAHTGAGLGYNCSLTLTDSIDDYAFSIPGGSLGYQDFGISDRSASGFGQIEVTRWAVIPGTWTAAQAAALYQKATTGQTVSDWSGNGNHGTLGASDVVGTDDPKLDVESRNLLAAGSTEDLTNAAWATSGASGVTSTSITLANLGYIRQSITTTEGAYYNLSVDAQVTSGGTDSIFYHVGSASGDSTAQTLTTSNVRYSTTVLGKVGGGVVLFGLRNVSGTSMTVTLTDWQVERVPLVSSSATDYVDPAEPQIVGLDLVTDDIINVASLALSGDKSFVFVLRPDAVSDGLFRNGTSGPNISIDAAGNVTWVGSSTVTASNPLRLGLFQCIGISVDGITIRHYLDGQPNGFGTSATGNDFTALRLGYDGTAYTDGAYSIFAAWSRNLGDYGHEKVCSEFVRILNWDGLNEREMAIPLLSDSNPWGDDFSEDFGV